MPSEAPREAVDVRATLARVLGDERGRWLLDPAHAGARSEWALAGFDGGEVVHVVLDRTFVAEGVRWIVDFKTGTHEGADPGAFLDAEVERYRPQLARYARIVSALDPAPIRLALYHPRVPGGWREFAVPEANGDAADPVRARCGGRLGGSGRVFRYNSMLCHAPPRGLRAAPLVTCVSSAACPRSPTDRSR